MNAHCKKLRKYGLAKKIKMTSNFSFRDTEWLFWYITP